MKAEPCTRSLAEQAEDRTGSRRRGDHALRRLDLLSDDELDSFRARYGSAALDEADVLAHALALRLEQQEEAARRALEDRIESRPILTVVVCMGCGAHEVARSTRAWAIDRAMRKSGLSERDVRAALALLIEAGGSTLDVMERTIDSPHPLPPGMSWPQWIARAPFYFGPHTPPSSSRPACSS